MKTFLKFTLVAIILTNCAGLFAQNAEEIFVEEEPRVTFQARAGLNLSNVTASWNDQHSEADIRVGFNVGLLADVNLGKSFYMLTGLMFSTKGANVDDAKIEGFGIADLKMTAMYLQVPLYFGYKIDFPNNNNKLGFALGPYFAYGIAGKTKVENLPDLPILTVLAKMDYGTGPILA